ncbi:MAG: 4-hydroxy-tetrahydrodipicolinate reductase [Bacteroidales bacterium]|nr:4-hydroxy-tetrahydrodipicolinate reductase [Bacteroidales bacterium]
MKIVISGYGKMGHEVERIAISRGHEVMCHIDTELEWHANKEAVSKCDAVIEFSTPTTVIGNINKCFDLNVPVVVGTTGWYDSLAEIKKRCEDGGHTMFYAPNFSIGMNFVFQLNRQMARFARQFGYEMEISETHHIHKLDRPSGTAVKLANDIIAENSNYKSWRLDEDGGNALKVNAIRKGEVFGIHEIKAISPCDSITLTHEASSREGFATGAVVAAEFLKGKTGVFTMDDLIEIRD